jgi:hypothetical protein
MLKVNIDSERDASMRCRVVPRIERRLGCDRREWPFGRLEHALRRLASRGARVHTDRSVAGRRANAAVHEGCVKTTSR